jgi:uncharacterized phiE125 gp8 family phage protein
VASDPLMIVGPVEWLVSLDTAKLQCRIDGSDEDALLGLMVAAAAEDCANVMQRAITPATWRAEFDGFADSITLSPAMATEVVSISYIDADGATQTLPLIDAKLSGGVLRPAFGKVWPATRAEPSSVTITYKSATWPDPESVPAAVKVWILLRVAALYENREAWTQGKTVEANPHIDNMLAARRFTL